MRPDEEWICFWDAPRFSCSSDFRSPYFPICESQQFFIISAGFDRYIKTRDAESKNERLGLNSMSI